MPSCPLELLLYIAHNSSFDAATRKLIGEVQQNPLQSPEKSRGPHESCQKELTASICCMFIVFVLVCVVFCSSSPFTFEPLPSLIKWRDLLVVAGNTWPISVVPPAESLLWRLIVSPDTPVHRLPDAVITERVEAFGE